MKMMQSNIRNTLLLVLTLSFVFCNGPLFAAEWPPSPEVTNRIDAARDMLNELVKAMPADLSDPQTLADTLDYEIEVAHLFVRDRVRFEPYLGVLKGPQGTAMTLAGNAFDQALLLANLINIMGGEAQLVTGSLDNASTDLLLNRAFVAVAVEPGTADTSMLIPILARYSQELADSFKQSLEQQASNDDSGSLESDTRKLADLLQSLVGLDTKAGNNSESLQRLKDQLGSSYAWVRWRDGPSDEWQALHPVFAQGQLPLSTQTGVITASVPEELQHRLAISLLIERQLHHGGGTEREAIMSTYSRPTAALFKQDLVIEMGPVPGPKGSSSDAAFILPYLNGAIAPGGLAVNALGLTANASDALGSGAAELFARLSTRMGSAIGALNGDSGEKGAVSNGPRLTGTVLQFKLQGPGFETQTVERRLVDFREAATPDFPSAFAFSSVVNVHIGNDTGTRVAREFIEQQSNVIAALPALFGVARDVLPFEKAKKLPEFRSLPGPSWFDANIYNNALTPAGSDDLSITRPSAFVMARHTRKQASGDLLTYSDIIYNPTLALRRSPDKAIHIDPVSVLTQGVRETLIESELMRQKEGWLEREPLSVITSKNELANHIAKAHWSTAAEAMASRDIENGFKLAITNVTDHWWRVDGKTGATLGMGALGGQEIVEKEMVLLIGGAVISTLFFYNSVESCDETYPDNQEMADCCIVSNLAVTYGSSVAGAVRASKATAAAVSNTWSAAAGKITAALAIETVENVVVNEVTSGLIDSACRAHLDQ